MNGSLYFRPTTLSIISSANCWSGGNGGSPRCRLKESRKGANHTRNGRKESEINESPHRPSCHDKSLGYDITRWCDIAISGPTGGWWWCLSETFSSEPPDLRTIREDINRIQYPAPSSLTHPPTNSLHLVSWGSVWCPADFLPLSSRWCR